jgi:hypothetical protein
MKTLNILILTLSLFGCAHSIDTHFESSPPPGSKTLNYGTLMDDRMECQNKIYLNEELSGLGYRATMHDLALASCMGKKGYIQTLTKY